MKRNRLWTGIAAAAVATIVATGWVQLSRGDSPAVPPTKSDPAVSAATAVSKAKALLQAGMKQGEINDSAGATRTFKEVLALDPGNKIAWYSLGVIAQQQNRTADARTAYDNALKDDPNFESALYNKAILLRSSDTDQAIAILQRIVAADPKAATAYLHLGQAEAQKGRQDAAEDAFSHAVRADPSLQQLVPEQFRDSASAAPTPTATQAGTR